jgi:cobalt-zinc-cadmium efflux system membrane fusion protein
MRRESLCLLLLFVACSRKPEAEASKNPAQTTAADGHSDEPEHEAMPTRVKLSPDVVADARIRVAPAGRTALDKVLSLSGEIVADPDKLARVVPPLAGRIENVTFKEGGRVRRGDALVTIRVPDFGKVKADYAATQARAASARSNADRLDALAQKGLAATQEVLSARAEADALEAQGRADAELLRAVGSGPTGTTGSLLIVRAPIDGVVLARDAILGQSVTTEGTLGTIANLAEVWFLARVFEKDLERLHVDSPAEVMLNAYPHRVFAGTVEYVRQQIDPVARTLTARIRLQNQDGVLRIGLFGNAQVSTGEKDEAPKTIVVPRSAVTTVGDKTVVFVREPDGDFEVHDVALGDGANGMVQILSGLREGELVVVDGAFTLKSVVLKSSLQEEGE